MKIRLLLGVQKMSMLKKILDYLNKVIQSNTGVSSLSFIIVLIGIMAVSVLIVICLCMLIEIIVNHTISSSLEGYAAIITSIAGLIAAVGIPKALNNFGENKYRREIKHSNNDEEFT